jgi:homoserine kinase type II
MAHLTPLPLADARRIAARFSLDVARVTPILAGSVNSNFALELEGGGRAFLRVYEEQAAAAAAREAALLDHLATGGVPTPSPLRREDGGFVDEHAGKPVALFPWREGSILCQRGVTRDAARAVGAALANVHAVGATYEGAGASRFGADELARRLAGLEARPLSDDLRRTTRRLAAALTALAARLEPAPLGVIHGDLFRDNVLWSGGSISALLDFESASRGSAAFDLAVTMLAWCHGDDLDLGLARAMGEGYASVRRPTDDERRAFYDEARFAALRFSITRITDFELRPAGTGVHKDYRRFVARLDALEGLGDEAVTALLEA